MTKIFDEFTGKKIKEINVDDRQNQIYFELENGEVYKMFHYQDCCENVYIESISENYEKHEGAEIFEFSEVSGRIEDALESGTWTFYKIRTSKGYIDIRWNGYSNGYYSERVSIIEE